LFMVTLPPTLSDWFAAKGWTLHPHQMDMLQRSNDPATLLIAPTGGGKTLAGFLPTLSELKTNPPPGLHTLYISPLKALTADIRRNLGRPIEGAGLKIRVEDRTGDTSYTQRRRQRADPPHILLTTPESLALLLSTKTPPGSSQDYNGLSSTKSTRWPNPNAATSLPCSSPACSP
jgi:ATP-dependent Lhr-like helicase